MAGTGRQGCRRHRLRGIGLGIARSSAAAGADVMLNGSRALSSEVDELREGLDRTFDVRTGYAQADATKPEQIVSLVERTSRELGAVDILVNNAGIQYTAPAHEFPVEKWDEIIAVNLSAAFHAIGAVLLLGADHQHRVYPRSRRQS